MLAGLAALSACKAETPALTDASGGGGNDCTPYADLLVAYTTPGGGAGDGEAALGAPDEASIPLTANAVLTVGFIGLGGVQDSATVGDDIQVHATAAADTEVDVFLSGDGEVWENAGTVTTDDLAIDIANTGSLTVALYVQLVGVKGSLQLDALESLQTSCSMPVR